MNRMNTELPREMVLGTTAVAMMAAVGLLSILPLPGLTGPSLPGVLGLTVPLAAGLLVTGRRAVKRARHDGRTHAITDPASGLSTPFAAEHTLAMEFAAAQRGRPLAVVLMRIDQFPRYAARHGRPVAERLLQLAARTLSAHRREMHVAAPYGSLQGWYLAVLSGMDVDGATVYAKRVRKALMSVPGLPERPSVSVGIVSYDVSMAEPDDLVRPAVRALKRASAHRGKILVIGQAP